LVANITQKNCRRDKYQTNGRILIGKANGGLQTTSALVSSELVRDDRTLALIVDTKVTTITMTAVEVMDTMVTIMLAVFLLAIVLIRGI
jgi:hypothetical protein